MSHDKLIYFFIILIVVLLLSWYWYNKMQLNDNYKNNEY